MDSIIEQRHKILDNIKKSVANRKLELEKLEFDAIEIAKRLKDALDAKDLSENAAYDIAVAETKSNSKQIALVKAFIDSYDDFMKICEKQGQSEYVRVGSTLRIKVMEGDFPEFVFVMVRDALADGGAGALSELSHPGKVLMGKRQGDEVLVRTSVTTYKCRILEVY